MTESQIVAVNRYSYLFLLLVPHLLGHNPSEINHVSRGNTLELLLIPYVLARKNEDGNIDNVRPSMPVSINTAQVHHRNHTTGDRKKSIRIARSPRETGNYRTPDQPRYKNTELVVVVTCAITVRGRQVYKNVKNTGRTSPCRITLVANCRTLITDLEQLGSPPMSAMPEVLILAGSVNNTFNFFANGKLCHFDLVENLFADYVEVGQEYRRTEFI